MGGVATNMLYKFDDVVNSLHINGIKYMDDSKLMIFK
jgi:hypothetical protein